MRVPRTRIVVLVTDQSVPGRWIHCARAAIDLRPARGPNLGGACSGPHPSLGSRLVQSIRRPSTPQSEVATDGDLVTGTAGLLGPVPDGQRLPAPQPHRGSGRARTAHGDPADLQRGGLFGRA